MAMETRHFKDVSLVKIEGFLLLCWFAEKVTHYFWKKQTYIYIYIYIYIFMHIAINIHQIYVFMDGFCSQRFMLPKKTPG